MTEDKPSKDEAPSSADDARAETDALLDHDGARPSDSETSLPDSDALMIALILAPGTYSRNKFFSLYEDATLREARRRAQMVRSLVKELTEPWPLSGEFPTHPRPVEVSERIVEGKDDEPTRVLSFRVVEFNYRREARLTSLEAAALRYCLSRARVGEISVGEKHLVERHLSRLSPVLT